MKSFKEYLIEKVQVDNKKLFKKYNIKQKDIENAKNKISKRDKIDKKYIKFEYVWETNWNNTVYLMFNIIGHPTIPATTKTIDIKDL